MTAGSGASPARDGDAADCNLTLDNPCPFNNIGDRQIGDACKRHLHSRCSGFTGGYDDALYTCACRCHRGSAS